MLVCTGHVVLRARQRQDEEARLAANQEAARTALAVKAREYVRAFPTKAMRAELPSKCFYNVDGRQLTNLIGRRRQPDAQGWIVGSITRSHGYQGMSERESFGRHQVAITPTGSLVYLGRQIDVDSYYVSGPLETAFQTDEFWIKAAEAASVYLGEYQF